MNANPNDRPSAQRRFSFVPEGDTLNSVGSIPTIRVTQIVGSLKGSNNASLSGTAVKFSH